MASRRLVASRSFKRIPTKVSALWKSSAARAGPEFVFVQTHDAVEFCQAVAAGTAARCSEEGHGGRGGGGPTAVSAGRPPSPHARRALSAVSDGPLAAVAEREAVDVPHAVAPSPFERQSRVSWER